VENATKRIIDLQKGFRRPQMKEGLEGLIQGMLQILDDEWNKNAAMSKLPRHSKKWWDKKCKEAYQKMEANPTPKNKVDPNRYKAFQCTTRESKKAYFNKVIHETATEKNRPWDLMPWARERKLPAVEAIINNEGISCILPNMILFYFIFGGARA
jgi:hypothetical protein